MSFKPIHSEWFLASKLFAFKPPSEWQIQELTWFNKQKAEKRKTHLNSHPAGVGRRSVAHSHQTDVEAHRICGSSSCVWPILRSGRLLQRYPHGHWSAIQHWWRLVAQIHRPDCQLCALVKLNVTFLWLPWNMFEIIFPPRALGTFAPNRSLQKTSFFSAVFF